MHQALQQAKQAKENVSRAQARALGMLVGVGDPQRALAETVINLMVGEFTKIYDATVGVFSEQLGRDDAIDNRQLTAMQRLLEDEAERVARALPACAHSAMHQQSVTHQRL